MASVKRIAEGVDQLDRFTAEVRHEALYYFRQGGLELAERFLRDLTAIVRRIEEAPRSFQERWPGQPGVRRVPLHKFPFHVGYIIGPPSSADPLLLVALIADKKRPGYWFGRVTKGLASSKRRRR